jgi:HAMP domain-containing protein
MQDPQAGQSERLRKASSAEAGGETGNYLIDATFPGPSGHYEGVTLALSTPGVPRIARSGGSMKLLVKFDLLLIALMGIALAGLSVVARSFLIDNAKSQVVQQAALMMESASSTRQYTTEELKPLLQKTVAHQMKFLPQTVPAYGATVTFARLRKKFPEYTYKEATLNPTNLVDRAVDWESDVIQQFRNHPDQKELIGERMTPSGPSLYLAHPITVQQSCLECHSVPAAAPRSMVGKYGSNNGFGWNLHDVVAAQIVSVPTEVPMQIAKKAYGTLMWSIAATFAAILIAINLVVYFLVIVPVQKLSSVAHQVSLGQLEEAEIPVRGSDEISELTAAFNRLFVSLSKALKMIN